MQATMTVPTNRRQIFRAFLIHAPVIVVMNFRRAIAAPRAVPSNLAAETRRRLGVIGFQFPSVRLKIFVIALLSVGHR
jgi:hypothetical protein